MNETLYPILVIAVVALVTFALRAFPFLLFAGKPLPETVKYLGKVLPASIMTILVIYCLRGTDIGSAPHGLPELTSCVLVVILQAVKKNMYVSIVAGTLAYMLLIRIM